jgi:general secretion pathway protein H
VHSIVRPHRGRGFTLLEVLVVVFIIGVVATLALLSVDNSAGDDRLQREARRLNALLGIAGEEAVLFGVELGFEVTRDGYRFMRLDDDGWTPITASDHPLRPRTLDETLTLVLGRTPDDGVRRRVAAAARASPLQA